MDAWAVACDVLTFYSERLANESFLRTATERTSLQELGKLVAYRLDPGVAAETFLAFSLERPPAPPPLDPPDPGLVPPAVPGEVVLPEGLRVQSVPGPGEEPQTFETVEEIDGPAGVERAPRRSHHAAPARHGPRGCLARRRRPQPGPRRRDPVREQRPRQRPLGRAAARPPSRWTRSRGPRTSPGSTASAPTSPPTCRRTRRQTFVLRKRLSVFGHNAPVWKAMNDEFRNGYRDQFSPVPADGSDWPFFTAVTTSGNDTVVDVDGAHPDIVVGSWVVLSQDAGTFYRELYEVVGRAELSRSAFAVSGKVTRLTLRGEAPRLRDPAGRHRDGGLRAAHRRRGARRQPGDRRDDRGRRRRDRHGRRAAPSC